MNLRPYRDRGIYRPEFPDFAFQFKLPVLGVPLEWSTETVDERVQRFSEEPVPIMTGLAFATAPFVIGAVGTA